MKNKLFNFNLYKLGLKQTKLMGMFFMIALLFLSVVTSFASVSSKYTYYRIVTGVEFNSFLLGVIIFVAPILTLSLFSFLNYRNSSDYYHSIPHKKEVLFVCFTASILTWITIIIWLVGLITLMIYFLFGSHISIALTSVLIYLINLTIGSFLVVSATILAMSITGTTLSNVVATILILFLPRMITLAFTNVIISKVPIIGKEAFGILGDYTYNIVFGMFFWGIDNFNLFEKASIYSSVLIIIYFSIAFYLFKRRKSETATLSATNNLLHNTIRIASSFIICIWGCINIISSIGANSLKDDIFTIIIIYIVALIIYFGYELITIKSFKSIANALVNLFFLIGLNALFIGGVFFSQNLFLNSEIKLNDIETVQILALDNQLNTYENIQSAKIDVNNQRAKQILLTALEREIELIKNNQFYSNNYYTHINGKFSFKLANNKKIDRYIRLTNQEKDELLDILFESKNYLQTISQLPTNPISVVSWRYDYDVKKVYDVLKEEVKEIGFEKWYEYLMRTSLYNGDEVYDNIIVSGHYQNKSFESHYPITNSTPKTLLAFVSSVNEKKDFVLDMIDNVAITNEYYLEIILYNPINNQKYYYYFNNYDNRIDEQIVSIIKNEIVNQNNNLIDIENYYYSVSGYGCTFTSKHECYSSNNIYFFNSNNEKLLEYLQKD